MDERTFKLRTRNFALETIKLIDSLPRSRTADVIAAQLLRSSTSVGANYRAACRARSTADMINKLRTVEEESDESIYWLESLTEAKLMSEDSAKWLLKEGNEILAMTIASIKTLQSHNRKSEIVNPK